MIYAKSHCNAEISCFVNKQINFVYLQNKQLHKKLKFMLLFYNNIIFPLIFIKAYIKYILHFIEIIFKSGSKFILNAKSRIIYKSFVIFSLF